MTVTRDADEHVTAAMLRVVSRTVTSARHGLIRDDGRSRQEFFALSGTAGNG